MNGNGRDRRNTSEPDDELDQGSYGLDEIDRQEALGREGRGRKKVGFRERMRRLANPVTKHDRKVYRRLFRYLRPYLGRVLISSFIAAIGGTLIAGHLFLLDNILATLKPRPPAAVQVDSTVEQQDAPEEQEPEEQEKEPGAGEEENRTAGANETAAGAKDSAAGEESPAASEPGPAAEVEETAAGEQVENTAGAPAQKKKKKKKEEEEEPAGKTMEEVVRWLSTGDPRTDLNRSVILMLILTLFGSVCKYIQSVIMATVSRKIIRNLREACFSQLVRLPLRFHQATHSGNVLARVIKDINRLKILLISLAMSGVQEFFGFLAVLGVIIYKTYWMAPVAILFLALVFIPIRLVADKLRHKDQEAEAGSSDMFAIISEALANQKVLKSFSAEKQEIKKFRSAARSVYRKQVVTFKLRSATEPLVTVVAGLAIACCIWVLGHQVLDQTLEIEDLAVVTIALQRLAGSAKRMGKMQNDFVRGITSASRVNAILEQVPEIKEAPNATPLEHFLHGIRFENVTFGYHKDQPVLENVSFEVERGEMVALVGPSGAGKTSLVDLLPRLYDVDDGRILIDGKDVRDYTLKSLRKSIGTVSQETMLFRDSIRDNIAFGANSHKVRDEAVIAAARAANAHEFIIAKPDGYDTPLGERGGHLSGGERQRIAIARALLRNPPILILDEATSALDAESEAQVQSALNYLMDGRTTLVIAHRLSTIRKADRIIVLDKGRIVESGDHEKLMQSGGRYARAYTLQLDALSRGEEDVTLDEFFQEGRE